MMDWERVLAASVIGGVAGALTWLLLYVAFGDWPHKK